METGSRGISIFFDKFFKHGQAFLSRGCDVSGHLENIN